MPPTNPIGIPLFRALIYTAMIYFVYWSMTFFRCFFFRTSTMNHTTTKSGLGESEWKPRSRSTARFWHESTGKNRGNFRSEYCFHIPAESSGRNLQPGNWDSSHSFKKLSICSSEKIKCIVSGGLFYLFAHIVVNNSLCIPYIAWSKKFLLTFLIK